MQPGLNSSHRAILKLCCELEIERYRKAALEPGTILQKAEHVGVDHERAVNSLRYLHDVGYIEAIYTVSEVPRVLTVTDAGFEAYAYAHIPNYASLSKSVGQRTIDHGERNSVEIAEALNENRVIVEHILQWFVARTFIEIRRETGGAPGPPLNISRVSPTLKQWLQES
jgi:hypothetical protein